MLKETSICITKYVLLFFRNSKQNAAIFPNAKGPWPQFQKGMSEPCKIFVGGMNLGNLWGLVGLEFQAIFSECLLLSKVLQMTCSLKTMLCDYFALDWTV